MIHTHFYGFSKPENGFVGKRTPLDRRFVWPVMNKFLQVEVIQLQLATSTATRFAIPIQDWESASKAKSPPDFLSKKLYVYMMNNVHKQEQQIIHTPFLSPLSLPLPISSVGLPHWVHWSETDVHGRAQ